MRKIPFLLGTTAIALALAMPGTASAQSAKAAGAQSAGTLFGTSSAWTGELPNVFVDIPGLSTSIKAPKWKELAIDVSVLCGVFTETKVKGKGGETDTTTAGSKIKIRVKVEPAGGASFFAAPGTAGVVFCDRQQSVSATFGGVIANLTACTGITITEACVLTDEQITLGIKTLNANAFNFFVLDLPASDTYTVSVEAQLDTCVGSAALTDTDPTIGDCIEDGKSDAKAFGFITGGSMFVEEVRFIRGDSL